MDNNYYGVLGYMAKEGAFMQSSADFLLTSKDDTLFKTIAHGKYGKVVL